MSLWNYTASMKKIHQIIKKSLENKEETKMTDRQTERQQQDFIPPTSPIGDK